MELYGALGNIELAGNFLVGEILEKRVQNFLFAAAKIGDGFGLHAPTLAGKDGIDETRKHRTGNPETTLRNERKRAGKLIASFSVGKNSFHAKTKKRVGVGFADGIADDDEARVGTRSKMLVSRAPVAWRAACASIT